MFILLCHTEENAISTQEPTHCRPLSAVFVGKKEKQQHTHVYLRHLYIHVLQKGSNAQWEAPYRGCGGRGRLEGSNRAEGKGSHDPKTGDMLEGLKVAAGRQIKAMGKTASQSGKGFNI